MAQRIFDLFRVHALGFGARRVMLWVVGSTATMGGGALLESMDDDTARRRRQGALVVPLPAAEGFKDPLLEDLLDEADTIAGRSAMPSSVLANEHPVQWLNESITPIWPFLDAGIRDFVVTKLQPAIQNAIPVVGKQIRFTEITLGHVPPQLGPVTTHLTDDGTNLELFVQVNYEGELALDLDAALATVRIGDLQIKGELMLAFKPLVDAINPIGGMEITCLDQPSIKLKLQAKGMFLDSVPNFYKLLQRTVDRVIADVLVMPNNIAFEIPTVSGAATDVPALKYRRPLGILRAEVDSAKHLPGHRWTMDPYVRLQVGSSYWFSDTVFRNQNPNWHNAGPSGSTHDFLVYHPKQCLLIDVMDENTVQADSLVGRCKSRVLDFVSWRSSEKNHPPASSSGDGEPVPKVTYRKEKLVFPLLHADSLQRYRDATISVNASWIPFHPVTAKSVMDRRAYLDGKYRTATAIRHPPDRGWREGNTGHPSGAENELILSVRVDKVTGSVLGSGPHKVRFLVKDTDAGRVLSSQTTHEGVPPAERALNIPRDSLAEIVRRLVKRGVPAKTVCASFDVTPADLQAFSDREAARFRTPLPMRNADAEWNEDVAWSGRVCARLDQKAAYEHPAFNQILHVLSPVTDRFTLQVLGQRKSPRGDLEEFVLDEAQFPLDAPGPFVLNHATVHGNVHVAAAHMLFQARDS